MGGYNRRGDRTCGRLRSKELSARLAQYWSTKMRKPKGWYGFKVDCDLWDFGQSNMSPPSKQQYCLRKGRDGKFREKYADQLSCHWNVCPKLKEERKMAGTNSNIIIDLTNRRPK